MAVDWEALDYSDPVALLKKLQPVYYRLIAGDADAEIEGIDRRRVKFHGADTKRLEAVIRQLKAEAAVATAAATGVPAKRQRFALVGRFAGGSPYRR